MEASSTEITLLDDPYVASHPENLLFWEAAQRGEFLGKVCSDCNKAHWYPRPICPFCGSLNTAWHKLSGLGKVYAFSTLRRAKTPYTVAYVELEEGPKVLTNLVDIEESNLKIDMPVKVVFRQTDEGRWAPKFTSAV